MLAQSGFSHNSRYDKIIPALQGAEEGGDPIESPSAGRLPPPHPAGVLEQARRLCGAGDYESALGLLEPQVAGRAAFDAVHALHLNLLLQLGRRSEAEIAFERAVEAPNASSDALDALAFNARRLGRYEMSRDLYARATRAAPDDAQLWYNLAAAQRTLGDLSEAAAACDRALVAQPGHAPSLILRSELLPASAERNHVADLRARLSADRGDRAQMFTAYALGKELHDLRQYNEAFAAFAHGAAVRKSNLAYDVSQDERKLARIQEAYATALRTPAHGSVAASGRHIFIVGLPRSGTTLTERILGALSGVRSNGETDNFATALIQSAPQGAGDIFERCSRADPACVAATYEDLAGHDGAAGHIIEKLPLNYLYVGAIAAALPEASIIWVRRHPVDSCFAMFRTLFGEGYPFSYDFGDLTRYYAAYDRLMLHWQAVLPDRLITVDYQALVTSPAAVGRDLAVRCGLAWTDDALDLSRNRAPSSTASASQVRGAIYASSAGIWRRYRRHLAPLVTQLRAAGVEVSGVDAD